MRNFLKHFPVQPAGDLIDDRGSDEREIVLCGNPNAGKSTVFNLLTGGNAHIANYPGVTVEVKHGHFRLNGQRFLILDTPGIYSISAQTEDEVVAESLLISEQPDVCLQVADVRNLARDLYLTVELMEMGYRPVLLLNKWDLLSGDDERISASKLEELLGLKCFAVSAKQPETFTQLKDYLAKLPLSARARSDEPQLLIDYGEVLTPFIKEAESAVAAHSDIMGTTSRYAALRLLTCGRGNHPPDGRRHRLRRMRLHGGILDEPCAECGRDPGLGWRKELKLSANTECVNTIGQEPALLIAEIRYAFVRNLLAASQGPAADKAVIQAAIPARKHNAEAGESKPPPFASSTDKMDALLLHPFWGYIIFLLGMWLIFQATFTIGAPLAGILESGVSWLADSAKQMLSGWPLAASITGEGIIPGVGLVIIFLPNILILFLALALLEDSGYLARGALLTDGVLRKCGLTGRAFIPMVIAFGCNVPAIMAARTMPTFKDRLITIAVIPWMSCSARLPVYILLAGAFFPAKWGGAVMVMLYILGIVLAVLAAKLLRLTVGGRAGQLVVELPDYRLPRVRMSLLSMWTQAWHYLNKAGTVILAAAIIVWFLFTFPQAAPPPALDNTDGSMGSNAAVELQQYRLSKTYAGSIGKVLEPVFRPLGFDWRITIGLLGAAVAKEVMVSTMGVVYGVGEHLTAEDTSLLKEVRANSGLTPLTALALMIFVLLYFPCLPALSLIYREIGSLRWTSAIVGFHFATAYALAFLVLHVGRLLGFS